MYIYIYVYTYACSCYTYIYTYIYINICMRLYQDQDKYTCRVLALPLRKELDFLAEEPYNQSKEPYIPSRPQRITILKCYAATQQIMHTTTKRAVYFVKQKEHYVKRALYSVKRAQYSVKRAHHLPKEALFKQSHGSNVALLLSQLCTLP